MGTIQEEKRAEKKAKARHRAKQRLVDKIARLRIKAEPIQRKLAIIEHEIAVLRGQLSDY